jgi:hypothetical protein
LLAAGVAVAEDAPPEVWMHHAKWQALAEGEQAWRFVAENVDGIQFFIDSVRRPGSEPLEKLGAILKKNEIGVSVECGGTLGAFLPQGDVGRRSAEHELAKLRNLTEAGIRIDYLNIDGAVRRLLYPNEGGRSGRPEIAPIESVDRAVDELLVYLREVRKEYPQLKFFILTNFPNWGYKGDVSYHARGPQRNDWGDYFPVIETILRKTRQADLPIAGLTVDNPYDYALGEHRSVRLDDPKQVDWIARVLDLERYAESEGLEFNLIVNSERGGQTSDQKFFEETLKFVDLYLTRGGTPKRLIVESWYPNPRAVVPETEPYAMTALVKAVIQRVRESK